MFAVNALPNTHTRRIFFLIKMNQKVLFQKVILYLSYIWDMNSKNPKTICSLPMLFLIKDIVEYCVPNNAIIPEL